MQAVTINLNQRVVRTLAYSQCICTGGPGSGSEVAQANYDCCTAETYYPNSVSFDSNNGQVCLNNHDYLHRPKEGWYYCRSVRVRQTKFWALSPLVVLHTASGIRAVDQSISFYWWWKLQADSEPSGILIMLRDIQLHFSVKRKKL